MLVLYIWTLRLCASNEIYSTRPDRDLYTRSATALDD